MTKSYTPDDKPPLDSGKTHGGIQPAGPKEKAPLATEPDLALDHGKTLELEIEKPAPRDEGDNPEEQAAAKERAPESIPPGSRTKPGPR